MPDNKDDLDERAAKNQLDGGLTEAKGRVRSAAADLTDNGSQQLKGKGEQLKGKGQQLLGDIQQKIADERRKP